MSGDGYLQLTTRVAQAITKLIAERRDVISSQSEKEIMQAFSEEIESIPEAIESGETAEDLAERIIYNYYMNKLELKEKKVKVK